MTPDVPDFDGVFVPHVTPLHDDESIDEQSLRTLVRSISETDGIGGLASCTRVGEGPVLDFEEKCRVFEIVAEESRDGVPIVGTVAPQSTAEAVRKVNAAGDTGVDAVMVIPPLLFAWGEPSPEMRYRFFEKLDAETDVPIVLFQVPVQSYWYDADTLARISHLESVVAIKEASFNVQLFTDVVHTLHDDGGEISILSGNDRFLAQSFMLGIDGALVGVANLYPEEWVEMYDLAREHRYSEALAKQEDLLELKELLFRRPIVQATSRIKYGLQQQGTIEGATVRHPQPVIDEEEKDELRRELERRGSAD